MHYIIYKITNQINGKFYIGSHKTKDLNDSYMGSGKLLKYAQNKYGIENFTKEILFIFDTPEEMYAKEAELVNECFLAEENTYNLKIGGFGGWDYINSNDDLRLRKNRKGAHTTNARHKDRLVEWGSKGGQKRAQIHGVEKAWLEAGRTAFLGKTHSEEAKSAIGVANSKKQKGVNNSQYGTRWIHSLLLKTSKKIGKTHPLPEGWLEGRKINF